MRQVRGIMVLLLSAFFGAANGFAQDVIPARVVPVEGAAAKRILWLLTRREMPYREENLTIAYRDGSFTSEYISLTKDFYLKM